MNKLIFKLFCSKLIFCIFFVVIAFLLSGCALNATGRAVQHMPSETNKEPKIYFCPRDDCGKVLSTHISYANFSVYCAFYDLELRNVISALAKKSKTADVRLVMDKSNYQGQIKGNAIRLDNDKQLMHNKFCVIDRSIVITGSFNPTDNDNNYNNNNMEVVHSNALAKNFEDEFGELWEGKFGAGRKSDYHALSINGIRIENYFCPEDCQMELSSSNDKDSGLYKIADLIKGAEKSVEAAAFTFTSEKVADELIRADERGVKVRVLIENRQRNVKNSQYLRLKDFGLNIKLDANKGTMHHKFIIIDDKIVITGSPNFTNAGFNKNDENMLIIYDANIASKFKDEFYDLWQ
ncbi:MAG: phospholipase D-like domain-containing protein [Nanoarchaeota archaeon]